MNYIRFAHAINNTKIINTFNIAIPLKSGLILTNYGNRYNMNFEI